MRLATSLSYFLWGSTSGQSLLAWLARRQLNDPETLLQGQVARMLRNPKGVRFRGEFRRAVAGDPGAGAGD